MLSPDPIKRRINPYPYCDNDPVNYNDPTGEIPSILLGAGLGGLIGGASGFIGSAASQLTGGGKFNWKKAAGAAANGAVVGAAKGALIGSGAGIPLAFATDFAAGSVGNALEQGITKGRVDLGESLISGAGNALSEVLYGTGPIRGVKDAFLRGARTGAVMSGLDNIARAAGLRGAEPGSNPGGGGRIRGVAGAGIPGHAGRDPRKMCGSTDPFDLAETLGDRKRSHSGRGRSRTEEGGGFSLGGLVKDVAIGGIVGGLGSAAFYGAGRAVDALRESFVERRHITPQTLLKGEPNSRVYLGIKDGRADYVGITYDIEKRQRQHGKRFDYLRQITKEPLTRRQARAIEQVLIEKNPQFSNKINSISPRREWYADAKEWGEMWVKRHGYLEIK